MRFYYILILITVLNFEVYSQVSSDSLVAKYSFSGDVIDESLNGYDGSINGVQFVEDRFGNLSSAVEFDGTDDIINFGIFDIPQVGSISFWINFDNTQLNPVNDWNQGIFGKWSGTSSKSQYPFHITLSDQEKKITYSSTSGIRVSSGPLDSNEWIHIVGTWDSTTSKIYVNGVLDSIGSGGTILNDGQEVTMGRWNGALPGWGWFDGKLDDFYFYERELNELEIINLYTANGWPFTDVNVFVSDNTSYSVSGSFSEIELIYIDESDSISAYQFDLEIPEGLTFTGLDTTSTLSSGGTFQTNVVDDTLKVAFSTTEYLAGDSLLVKLQFDADGSGDYEIAPFNFVLNNMDIDSVTPGILSVVELLGDVDDNDSIQAYDGALALQYSVDIDPIPSIDALPWDNWRVAAADVDRDGSVLALDASYILQKTVGLIDEFPNAVFKSLPIELIVQQDENHLVFATASEGLIGFNTSIPTSDVLVFNEPIYSWSESIQAINQKENSLEIGIASHIPASGEFMRIPFTITEEQSFEIEINKNNVTQVIAITLSTDGVEAELVSEKVRSFELGQNYPNPFNPSTNINFSIPQSQHVTLKVYDISGREVATLVEGIRNIGEHTINFDATNLASGVYIYQLISGAQVHTKRMLLIK